MYSNIKAEKLSYIKFKNGKPHEVEITNEYFEEKLKLIEKVKDVLYELSEIVRNRHITKKPSNSNTCVMKVC